MSIIFYKAETTFDSVETAAGVVACILAFECLISLDLILPQEECKHL